MAATVIITRPRGPYPGDEGLATRLLAEGFSTINISVLSVEARALSEDERAGVRTYLNSADAWIAFLSPTAAHIFNELAEKMGCDLSSTQVRIAAQGPGTSEAVRKIFNREVDLESSISTAEVFGEQLSLRLGGTGMVLIPQSADGRDVLGPILRSGGNEVLSLSTYELVTITPSEAEIEAVRSCTPENSYIVFMSPSAVRATAERFPDIGYLRHLRAISVGPSTSKALREAGCTVFAEAKEHTEGGVVACLRKMAAGE